MSKNPIEALRQVDREVFVARLEMRRKGDGRGWAEADRARRNLAVFNQWGDLVALARNVGRWNESYWVPLVQERG